MRNSKTFIHTFIDDQIDSDIIFDDPYVEDNGGKDEHDSNAHDRPNADIESVIYNVQVEAENQRKMNNELGYQNPDCIKKAIATNPMTYNGQKLINNKLKVDLPNYEETLEDAEESRLKMKDKMILLGQLMGSKGLNECKNSASNLRGIQVKYIIKEVEDYLKTYSSADGYQMQVELKREHAKACALDYLCEIVFQETDWASVDDEGKLLKPSNSMLPISSNVVSKKLDDVFNEDDDSDVEKVERKIKACINKGRRKVYNESTTDDDDFDDPGLTNAQMKSEAHFVRLFSPSFELRRGIHPHSIYRKAILVHDDVRYQMMVKMIIHVAELMRTTHVVMNGDRREIGLVE
ncbi:hypothetical protein Tco_1024357 [Tanacetum coccineum]